MAHSSGRALDIPKEAVFDHQPSRTHYTVRRNVGHPSVRFRVNGVEGERPLGYFIGSGRVGRSYLFQSDGFLFEAPVSWYASRSLWDVSPGYRNDSTVNLTRPVEPACLECHASGVRPIAGTVNKYAAPPFAQEGVTCDRCHGDGEEHAHARGPIVNPSKLDAERRDSVCQQCHLSGAVRIPRSGSPKPFNPAASWRIPWWSSLAN